MRLTLEMDVRQLLTANKQARKELAETTKTLRIVADSAKATQSRMEDLAAQQKELQKLVASMKKAGDASNVMGKAMKGAMAYFSMQAIMDAGKALLDTAMATDRLSKAYTTIEGSTAGANQQLEFIRQTSERLGLEFLTTAESAKTLFASAQGTTLEDDVNRVFEAFSKAGTALSLTGDQMQGVFLALGQMISKGKVQAEELRGQLGERLPGAFQIAAQAMNMTTAELDKFMADGKLTAEELLPRMAEALEVRFAGAADEAAHGLQAAVNRMNNAWTDFKTNVTDNEAMIDAINGVSEAMKKLSEYAKLRSISETFRQGVELAQQGKIDFEAFTQASFTARQKMVDDALAAGEAWGKVEADRVENIRRRAEAAEKAAQREAEAERKARAQIDEYLAGSAKNRQERERQMFEQTLAQIDTLIAKYKTAGLDTSELVNLRGQAVAEYDSRKKKLVGKTPTASTGQQEQTAVTLATQRAQILKQIADLSGNVTMSEQAQVQLIALQAEELRKLYPDLTAIVNKWERLAKLNSTTEGYLSQELQIKRLKATWEDYYKNTMDWGTQLGNITENAFQGMEDALVQFTMTGKLSFSDMVNSMIADLARLAIRQSITGPLFSALTGAGGSGGGLFGSLFPSLFGGGGGTAASVLGSALPSGTVVVPGLGFHSGGVVGRDAPTFTRPVPELLFADAPRFHGGTGYIKPDEYPAILKAGERVLSPAETRDYQRGGGETNVNVVIHNSTGQQATTRTTSDNYGNKTIDVYVGEMAAKQMATPGTTLNRAVSAQTGTRRPAIRR